VEASWRSSARYLGFALVLQRIELSLVWRSARRLALVVVASIAVGSLLLLVASASIRGGIAVTAVGLAAAVTLIAQLVTIAQRRVSEGQDAGRTN